MKALVLGGGSDHLALISRLKERGAYVVLVDYYENPPARIAADRHHVVSTLDQKGVLAVARYEKCDVVLTACVDQATLTAAWVSERLRLPFYLPYATARLVSNKAEMKRVFAAKGIPTPRSLVVSEGNGDNLGELEYPLVVKPADANGSFGVTKVCNPKELGAALQRARHISRTKTAVVDEYMPGEEISVDAYVSGGQATVLLLTCSSKLPNSTGCFPIYQSLHPTPLSRGEIETVRGITAAIPSAFGLEEAPLVVQMIRSPLGLKVIEFGARIAGGSKHHLIKRLTGCDVMAAFVQSCFGQTPRLVPGSGPAFAATRYIYSRPATFGELRGAERLVGEGVIDGYYLYKTPGMRVEGSSASRDRVAGFITTAESRRDLEQRLAVADAALQVCDEDGHDVMLHARDMALSGVVWPEMGCGEAGSGSRHSGTTER